MDQNQIPRRPLALSPADEDFCSYAGMFGVLISISALIQTFIFAGPHWITYVLLCIYCGIGFSYAMLGLRKHFSAMLMAMSTAFVLLSEALYVFSGVFSLTVVILLVYTIIITGIIFSNNLWKKLKVKKLAEREEEEYWKQRL